jgi:hypothetical protein
VDLDRCPKLNCEWKDAVSAFDSNTLEIRIYANDRLADDVNASLLA